MTPVRLCWYFFWPLLWLYPLVVQPEWETAVALALMALALAVGRSSLDRFRSLKRKFAWLARRKRLAVLAVGAAPLLVRAALLPIFPIPVPLIQDEASYLLGADTFASGRVTNPSHPMWIHLESVHVNHTPTYNSKYPPAQALALALGQILGHPWIGVWLSIGLMCAAICWMLQGWFPPEWALFGAFLAAARLGVDSYWMNSYWGGAVAAFGGALLFGAYPRLLKRPKAFEAAVMGCGLLILANSRPLEGLIVSLPVAAAMAVRFWRVDRLRLGAWMTRVALPIISILMVGGLAMAYYNSRTTGDALQFPYTLNHKTYSTGPLFVWQRSITQHEYRHELHRKLFVGYGDSVVEPTKHLSTFLPHRLWQYLEVFNFYLGPLLLIPLLAVPWLIRDRRIRLPVLCLGIFMAFDGLTISFQAHYWAPATCLIWAVVVQSMRHLSKASWGPLPIGRWYVALLPAACIVALVCCQMERAQATPLDAVSRIKTRCKQPDSLFPTYQREAVRRILNKMHGHHLVLVHYTPEHPGVIDWVFNRADIDASKIVWAYDMGAERNQELIDYYQNRTVWFAEPDVLPYRLTKYYSQ